MLERLKVFIYQRFQCDHLWEYEGYANPRRGRFISHRYRCPKCKRIKIAYVPIEIIAKPHRR